MKNLISMREFVLEQTKKASESKCGIYEYIVRIRDYANFLSQPLTLGMFVPTDLEGNVLEEPNIDNNEYFNWTEFNEAKERCLFECVEVNFRKKDNGGTFISFYFSKDNFFCGWFFNGILDDEDDENTIEDLVKYIPTLTPTALKQIGL